MSDFAPLESLPDKITRRDFLKTTAAGIAGLWFKPEFSFTLPPSPEWSVKLRAEFLGFPENIELVRDYQSSLEIMAISAKYAVPNRNLHPFVTQPNLGTTPRFNDISQISRERKRLPNIDAAAKIIGQIGVQTSEQISLYNQYLTLQHERFQLETIISQYQETGDTKILSMHQKHPGLFQKVDERIIQLNNALIPQAKQLYLRCPDYNPRYNSEANVCNIYVSDVLAALGMEYYYPHWINDQGKLTELSASKSADWLKNNHQKRQMINVTNLSVSKRQRLLSKQHFFIGTNEVHVWLVIPVQSPDGSIKPAITQATYNNLFIYPSSLVYPYIDPPNWETSNPHSQNYKWYGSQGDFGKSGGLYMLPKNLA